MSARDDLVAAMEALDHARNATGHYFQVEALPEVQAAALSLLRDHGKHLLALLDTEPVAWIPMSEGRIPEPTPYPDGKSYRVAIVALNDGSGVYLSEAMYDEGEGKWLTAGSVPESHFTHWRPFPAPPGGQR